MTTFIVILVLVAAGIGALVYFQKSGKVEDKNNNLIPDQIEEKIEEAKEVVAEVKEKAKRVKKEVTEVVEAAKEVVKQSKDVVKAAKTPSTRKTKKSEK